MEKDFNKILSESLGYEGGYDDSMAKDGVISNFGITQKLYDAYNKDNPKDVKDITYGEARDIYYDEFYKPLKIEKFKSNHVKSVIFDYAINSGRSQAVKDLQNIVGSKPDGIIGKKTLKKLDKFIKDNGESELINQYINSREHFLKSLVIKNPEKYGKNINGWMNRLNSQRQKHLQLP